MKTVLIYLSFVFLCGPASAQMRMWIDRNGDAVEGEYVRMGSSQVTVRDRAGKAQYITLKSLSKKDAEYLSTVVVPDVMITFSKRTRGKWRSEYALASDKIEIVTGTVTIKAKQKFSNDKLRAEAYLIGAEVATPDYRIKSKVSLALKFTEENDFTAEFQLEMESRQYEEFNYQGRGTLYDGYVVLVLNQNNEVIVHKTNVSWVDEEAIPPLRKFKVNAFFNKDLQRRGIPRPDSSEARVGVQD